MRIAVIGNGIVGTATAAWLQREGHYVTFIDPLGPAEATSFGNAGSLSPSACLPVGMPGMWKKVPTWLLDPLGPLTVRWWYAPVVAPWLMRFLRHSTRDEVIRIATALRNLLGPIFDCYEPLLQRAGAMGLMTRSGCLYVYSGQDAAKQWSWGMNLRRSLGVDLRDVSEDELVTLEPDLKGRFRFGILAPENGSTVDPAAFTRALYAQCERDGAQAVRRRATGFQTAGGLVTGVTLEDGETLDCEGVVLAGGAWSAQLASHLGARIPLETQRGYHVTVESSNLSLRHTVMAVEHNIMANPMQMGLRIAGSVEFAGLNAEPDYRRADVLLTRAQDMFPHLDTSRTTKWMGHRPCLPDSLPVIGRAPGVDNAWFAFGHGHVGMCGAATTGREIAALVAGRRPEVDLTAFSPRRFGR
ncbi:NAD(P)/FAD-dependent oxidoreductase [Roseococcus sp. YIM B11640]|uniref:NAD(P)/FAD-dependent oxidoreductase n=1 Tax=Roseococcus sp. YIM B11640 TaxID=3133973 RepID=UPI003C7C0FD1